MRTRPAHVIVVSLSTLAVAMVVAWMAPANAVSTRSFILDDAASLAAGELDGTAVLSDGSVIPGIEVRRIALDDVPVAWSFARGPDGAVYIGTGNAGKIYRLRGDDLAVFAETEQLLVSALAVGANGKLYAGTLPEGRIYEVDGQGQVAELTRPEGVEHVWQLVYDPRRQTLFAATGPEGRLYAIDGQGRANVFWDSDAAHVMSLDVDSDGAVYAGTDGDAVVVRLRAPGRGEVVYDFPGNEITAIDAREGVLAVAANEFPDPPSAATSKVKTSARPARPRPGKGRLWRVGSDGRAEQIHENAEGHFTSVQLAEDGTIYAGVGHEGRIHRVGPDQTSATWIDVDERQVLGIDLIGRDPLFVTGDAGAIYRVVGGRPAAALWTSKVLDASFPSRFGRLSWRGSGQLQLQTRSGNREEPDDTWSEWSAAISTPGPIRSPAGRFLQVRARFPEGGDPVIHAVTAFYLPQNQRARVHGITIESGAEAPSSPSKNKNKNDATDRLPEPSTRYKLKWKVDNIDQDELRYRLRFREERQSVWRDVLRETEELTEAEYVWDTAAIPDGWYVVQVIASDEPSNPPSVALDMRTESEPLLIDNHAPQIDALRANGTRVGGRVVDGLGPIARLEYAVDGGPWRLFFPSDDLLDSAEEAFEIDVGPMSAGTHIVAVRASDAGGNPVTAELTISVR
jgi:sugar lactone lactonase YvrE